MDGIELNGENHTGAFFHVVCLGKTDGISRNDSFENAMQKAREQNCLMVLAHPRWTGNTFVDEAHLRPEHQGWNGGWIVVNAPELTKDGIFSAIKLCNYYSSCGPEFRSITFDGRYLNIECSPVQFIRLVGPGLFGWRTGSFDGKLVTEASVEIPLDWDHVFIEIKDIILNVKQNSNSST
jgi:hypothetical protein